MMELFVLTKTAKSVRWVSRAFFSGQPSVIPVAHGWLISVKKSGRRPCYTPRHLVFFPSDRIWPCACFLTTLVLFLFQLNAALRGKDGVHSEAEIAEWREVALLLRRALAKLKPLCVALYRGLDLRVPEVCALVHHLCSTPPHGHPPTRPPPPHCRAPAPHSLRVQRRRLTNQQCPQQTWCHLGWPARHSHCVG